MGIKASMRAFVRSRLSGLNNKDVYFLTDCILNLIGYQPKNFMKASERNNFESLFREKFDEIFNEYTEITPYEFYLIKKKIEAQSEIFNA